MCFMKDAGFCAYHSQCYQERKRKFPFLQLVGLSASHLLKGKGAPWGDLPTQFIERKS